MDLIPTGKHFTKLSIFCVKHEVYRNLGIALQLSQCVFNQVNFYFQRFYKVNYQNYEGFWDILSETFIIMIGNFIEMLEININLIKTTLTQFYMGHSWSSTWRSDLLYLWHASTTSQCQFWCWSEKFGDSYIVIKIPSRKVFLPLALSVEPT